MVECYKDVPHMYGTLNCYIRNVFCSLFSDIMFLVFTHTLGVLDWVEPSKHIASAAMQLCRIFAKHILAMCTCVSVMLLILTVELACSIKCVLATLVQKV